MTFEQNQTPSSEAIFLRPGDRLIGLDADKREVEYTVLSVVTRETEAGQTVSSFVLRMREGWTTVVGAACLTGPNARFRILKGGNQAAA
ncbi:hypothetical protein EON82_22870 [bacterium]|nr:MAG: hypothetical protein EON82_22870 [bacterium]